MSGLTRAIQPVFYRTRASLLTPLPFHTIYDNIGRLNKDRIVNTGAYVRYEYPANTIQSKMFSTIVDTNNSNVLGGKENLIKIVPDLRQKTFGDFLGAVHLIGAKQALNRMQETIVLNHLRNY